MYLDTHTKDSMIASICVALKISSFELRDQLSLFIKTAKDHDEYIQKIDNFINERLVYTPDEILFFHLTRRLYGTEDNFAGYNLSHMLTTENAFSNLMKRAGIEFIQGENYIDTLYKGRTIDWDKCYDGNPNYMKCRLGFFKGREDFCFNGFALKDLLYKNDYARDLFNGPEFLSRLVECLHCDTVQKTYMAHSTFFCYEYKIPLEFVMFDGKETYSFAQKQKYIVKCVLLRLAQYYTNNPKYMWDDDNPILRLGDNETLSSQYYLTREEVTADMLE